MRVNVEPQKFRLPQGRTNCPERKLTGRRSASRVHALIDIIMTPPVASAGMIAKEPGITPRAAQAMVAELGLRELTGRGRYRAGGNL